VLTPHHVKAVTLEEREQRLKDNRSTRLGEPGDIASMVAMLMSDEGYWIQGQVISVDGGSTMR